MKRCVGLVSVIRTRLAKACTTLWRDEAGSPAVEFALIAPVFLLILAATFDIGAIIHGKFRLDAQVSSAASYAQIMGKTILDASATGFAGTLATMVSGGTGITTATVILNNGARANFINGIVQTTDLSGDVAQCYCPSRVAGSIQWGSTKVCHAVCADGSTAGRFMEIGASTPHIALFGGYGLTDNGTVSASALVRLE